MSPPIEAVTDEVEALNQTNNPKLRRYAQKLRRDMTKEERRMRYSNDDINRNFEEVCADLLRRMNLPGAEEA